ncbi:IclR family transcriptional regulator [Pseudomonas putida]|nr:IclR family transcriptional regulator [Pseudomonas putida]
MSDSTPNDLSSPDTRTIRALLILERVAQSTQPITSSRLAQRLEIPKTTLSRLLATLVDGGYLTRYVESDGYVPGPRATELALAILRGGALTRTCRSVLRGLVQVLGESCNLTALDHDQVIHIERVETAHPLRFHVLPGSRHPLHCTAGGKLFLAMMPAQARDDLISRLKLTRMTPQTLTSTAALKEALDKIREGQLSIDDEEYIQGMIGVAVPVFNTQGEVTAAIVCHAAKARANLSDLLNHVAELRSAARELSGLVIR